MTVPTEIGWNEPFEIASVRFVTTCPSVPEQYDCFIGDAKVGYVRLRCGEMTVHCPDVDGELVFEAQPDGMDYFEPYERENWLSEATDAIRAWHLRNKKANQ